MLVISVRVIRHLVVGKNIEFLLHLLHLLCLSFLEVRNLSGDHFLGDIGDGAIFDSIDAAFMIL